MKRCAFLTCRNLTGFVHDDHLLKMPLRRAGWEVQEVAWDDEESMHQDFDVAVIRTTWDYTERLGAFLESMEQLSKRCVLHNSFDIIRWNSNKSYLEDLRRRGVPIVPTVFCSDLKLETINSTLKEFDVDEFILKPVVGANARKTFRLTKNQLDEKWPLLSKEFSGQTAMIQPFLHSILKNGEWSLHFFNGNFSHAVLKTPKENDFRVQEEHGGIIQSREPPRDVLASARAVIQSLGTELLYARVDMVVNEQGQALLMELELIEPALYLRTSPRAAQTFVDAFVVRCGKQSF